MAEENVTSQTGDESMTQTDAERVADDIRWLFRTRDEWAICETEIVAQLDADEDRINTILDRMEDANLIEKKTCPDGRLWALLT